MTAWNGTAQAHLNTRAPFILYWFFHSRPKTFAGVVTPHNLFTGVGTITNALLTPNGNAPAFTGVGDGLEVGEIVYEAGTDVCEMSLQVYLTAQGEDYVRNYDTRLAPAEVWAGIQHPDTLAFLGFKRWFKGFVDGLDIAEGAEGGVNVANIALVTQGRFGTMSNGGKKSRSSQRKRFPTDAMRDYGDQGTKTDDPWGSEED